MKKTSFSIFFAAYFLVFFACSSKDIIQKTPEQLDLQKAKSYQKAARYDLALERYETIKNKYPLSSEAIEAELEIAETYYLQGSYVESLAYFKSFQDLHPNHSKVDFASFKIAMSHYKQIPSTIDRDLTTAAQAVEAFDHFSASHPKSSYAKQASEKRRECLMKLAEKELYVANFYLQRKKYSSAMGRLKFLLQKYPNLGFDEKALFHLGLCYYYLKEKSLARQTLIKFLKQFPKSEYAAKANAILKDI